MGWRFRKTIPVLSKFLRLNVSKSGVSVSAGVPGATVNVNENGVMGTVGVPGTGLSYRTARTGPSKEPANTSQPSVPEKPAFPSDPVIGAPEEDWVFIRECADAVLQSMNVWMNEDREGRLKVWYLGIVEMATHNPDGWGLAVEWWATRLFKKLDINPQYPDSADQIRFEKNRAIIERKCAYDLVKATYNAHYDPIED